MPASSRLTPQRTWSRPATRASSTFRIGSVVRPELSHRIPSQPGSLRGSSCCAAVFGRDSLGTAICAQASPRERTGAAEQCQLPTASTTCVDAAEAGLRGTPPGTITICCAARAARSAVGSRLCATAGCPCMHGSEISAGPRPARGCPCREYCRCVASRPDRQCVAASRSDQSHPCR